jgi:hypothetical protein
VDAFETGGLIRFGWIQETPAVHGAVSNHERRFREIRSTFDTSGRTDSRPDRHGTVDVPRNALLKLGELS